MELLESDVVRPRQARYQAALRPDNNILFYQIYCKYPSQIGYPANFEMSVLIHNALGALRKCFGWLSCGGGSQGGVHDG
jgi:hypothetical protein